MDGVRYERHVLNRRYLAEAAELCWWQTRTPNGQRVYDAYEHDCLASVLSAIPPLKESQFTYTVLKPAIFIDETPWHFDAGSISVSIPLFCSPPELWLQPRDKSHDPITLLRRPGDAVIWDNRVVEHKRFSATGVHGILHFAVQLASNDEAWRAYLVERNV